MFVHGRPFQPSLIFASKTRVYLSEATFRCSILGLSPGFTHKHYGSLEMLARDKHSSLLWTLVNYRCKKSFISLRPARRGCPEVHHERKWVQLEQEVAAEHRHKRTQRLLIGPAYLSCFGWVVKLPATA